MKDLTNLSKPYLGVLVWCSCALALGALTSCEKLTNITDKAQSLFGDVAEISSSSLKPVDEKEGMAVIADETRLVLVEFYSDT